MKNKPLNIIDKIINSEVVGDTLFLHLYGYLGEGPDRISFQDVFSQVNNKAEQVKNIVVKLNSGGGCLFTGLAIKDYLEKFKSKVSIHVEGMAASAASFIALAGKELLMSPTSRFMIHNPYIPSIEMNKGDAKEFQQVASSLFKDENMMIKIYSEKTGKTPEEIKSMMDEETTFFASEAIENGFADGIILVNNLLPMNCIGFKEDNKQTELYTIKLQEEYFKMKNKLQLNAAIVKSIANELGIEEETVENVAEKIEAAEETVEAPKEEVEETVAEAEEEVVEEEVKAEVIDKAELMELITALTVDGSINAEELITALSAPSPEAAYKALFIARKNTQIKAKVTARKEIQTLNSVAAPNKSDELKSGWMLKPLSIR